MSGVEVSSRSAAIQKRNEELEAKLAAAAMSRSAAAGGSHPAGDVSSRSKMIQQRNQELESLLEEKDLTPSSTLGSLTLRVHQRHQRLQQKLSEMLREKVTHRSGRRSSASAAIQQKKEDLEQKLADLERRKSWSPEGDLSSASVAIQQKNQELEQKLAELRMKESSSQIGLSSASVAIQQKNQELEQKLAELERIKKSGPADLSSASVAIQQKNQELEQKLAELERKKLWSPAGLSSASVAIQQKNLELEQKLAALETRKELSSPVRLSSASVAVQQKNQELEEKLAELERKKTWSPAGLSTNSVAIQQKNQELEQKLAELQRKESSRAARLSSASVAIQQKNRELEQKLAELKLKGKNGAPIPLMLGEARAKNLNLRMIELKKLISESQELDIAFLVDVTGSMQPYINSVKEKAPDIAAGVKKDWPQLKLRIGFAPYRDYEDIARDNEEKCNFTSSFSGPDSVFVKALSRVQADGGADDAEDVFSGLERVATLGWSSRTRVLVHIGDAPCHGKQFHDGVPDDYPEGDFRKREIGSLLKVLRDDCQIICYLFCHINDTTTKMIRAFKKECGDGNWIQERELGNIDRLVDVVVSVSCNSISQSMQVGEGGPAVRKFVNLPVKPERPLWNTIPYERATQIKYKLPGSLEGLFHILASNGSLEMDEMADSLKVQIAQYPFSADGNIRWPYHALVHQPPQAPRPMVVKRFKTPLGQDVNQVHAKEAYCQQMEVQTVAAKMAEEFTKEIERLNIHGYKTVQFTLVSTLKVGSKYYNMEKYLAGNWIRYSNNLNYVNTKEYAATLHAFSHWTHHRSRGLLMVTDLQGVEIEGSNGYKEFWLCDPAVHCKDALRYERTKTNWSEPGFKRFFEAHQCNNICHSLHLTPTENAMTNKGTHIT